MSIPYEEAYVRGGMGEAKHVQRTASKLHFRGQGSKAHRGKHICNNQEDRGECRAFAYRKEIPEGLGAENQMGM